MLNHSVLRDLRIALGQTQEEVTVRALASPLVRPTFNRAMIAKAEARTPEGLRSHTVRFALAIGLGLTVEDFESYMAGVRSLDDTVARSSIKPNPYAVERLRRTELRRGRSSGGVTLGDGALRTLELVLKVGEAAGLPADFLRAFEKDAREQGEDRPAFEWVDDMRAQASAWKRRHEAAAAQPQPQAEPTGTERPR